jgi:hypothetical protein
VWSGFWFCGAQTATGETPPADAQLRQAVIGTWEDDYQGHRTMTVRADGTATMVVRLQGWKAFLYASELQFEMLWSIDHGRMKKRTTGGQPAGKVKMILKALGDETEEQILELSHDRLLLLDRDGKRQYDWRRAAVANQP